MELAKVTEISHPASLEGLEDLLDRIFAVDYSPPEPGALEMKPYVKPEIKLAPAARTPIISGGTKSEDGRAEAEAAAGLLRAQLAYSRAELKEVRCHSRWLETQIVVKDEQLGLMGELFQRAAKLTAAEKELDQTRADLSALQSKYDQLAAQADQSKQTLWWRLGQLLGFVA